MSKAEELNRTVLCRLSPSPLGGIGVFAIQDIPKGTFIQKTDGESVITLSEQEFDLLTRPVRKAILTHTLFKKGYPLSFIHPNRIAVFQSYMNHSDDPNSTGTVALRDIMAGEEITESYSDLVGEYHELSENILEL